MSVSQSQRRASPYVLRSHTNPLVLRRNTFCARRYHHMLGIILDHSRRKSAAIELKLFAIASLESLLRLRSSHTLVLGPEKRVHVARQADCFLSEHEYLTIFLSCRQPYCRCSPALGGYRPLSHFQTHTSQRALVDVALSLRGVMTAAASATNSGPSFRLNF